jgi:hypothetical protein
MSACGPAEPTLAPSVDNEADQQEVGPMVKNMGIEDRVIRVLLAIVVGILYLTGTISGTLAVILGIVAVVFLVTSIVGFCPGYVPLKIKTLRKS